MTLAVEGREFQAHKAEALCSTLSRENVVDVLILADIHSAW